MYARYLDAVSTALRAHVRGQVDGKAANIVDECVSTLAALANALDSGMNASADPVAVWLNAGPVESPGIHRDVADSHAACVAALRNGGGLSDPAVASALERERQQGRAAIDRMKALMALPSAQADDSRLGLDPTRVERYLHDVTGNPSILIQDFHQILGGRSRQTALFGISGDDSLPVEMVVQRLTPGLDNGPAFGGTAVEFQLLQTLHAAGMSVPRALFMATDPALLGAPFMIMQRTGGTTVQPDFWGLPNSPRYAVELAGQMAILHAQPLGKLGTILPRPRAQSDTAGWLGEIDALANRLLDDAHGPSVTIAAAVVWLRDHAAGIGPTECIVHNDMMFHNVLAQDGRITAILDWEQVAVGHPAEDLGYCYPTISAMGAWDDFLSAYFAAGGQRLTQQEVDFFALRAILRLMVLVYDGRCAFEKGRTDEVVIAGAGAGFIQRLHQRLSEVLSEVLGRG